MQFSFWSHACLNCSGQFSGAAMQTNKNTRGVKVRIANRTCNYSSQPHEAARATNPRRPASTFDQQYNVWANILFVHN